VFWLITLGFKRFRFTVYQELVEIGTLWATTTTPGKRQSGVNFINILGANSLYELHFGSFFYVHVTREKLPK